MGSDYIFLDHAATTPLSLTAKKILHEELERPWVWANASSVYSIGRTAKEKLEEARWVIAKCIGAEPEEIFFNSGSTESINYLIKGVLDSLECTGNTILMSPTEHPVMGKVANYMKSTGHFDIDYCEVDKTGSVDIERFKRHLGSYRAEGSLHGMASTIHVGNELGNVNPIKELSEISHSYRIPFFSDTTQSIGKTKVDVKELGIDYCFASGSKLGALRQSGFFYVSNEALVNPIPLICGSQEKGARGGTESVLNAWVLARCLEAHTEALERSQEHAQGLKEYLVEKLNGIDGVVFNGSPLSESAYGIGIVNFSIPNMKMDGDALQLTLSSLSISLPSFELPVYVSTGSACSSGSASASHVLMALPGMSQERAARSIRVSFGADTTVKEIDFLVDKLKYVLEVFG